LSGVSALWDSVYRVCGGGGGCAGGGVPLGALPVLSWCGEVSLGGTHSIIITLVDRFRFRYRYRYRERGVVDLFRRPCATGGFARAVLVWGVSLGGKHSSTHLRLWVCDEVLVGELSA